MSERSFNYWTGRFEGETLSPSVVILFPTENLADFLHRANFGQGRDECETCGGSPSVVSGDEETVEAAG